MIQIILLTNNDDKFGSTNVDVMLCSSINSAKEIILNKINKDFDGNWKSLEDAAIELTDLNCSFSNNVFFWNDNGKGEMYIITRLNEREVNTKFQYVATI